jgi:hypothetical protein
MKQQTMILEFLKENGFMPKAITENELIFKSEGKTFLIITDDRDTQYLRIVLPNFWSIDSNHEEKLARETALLITKRKKATKIIIEDTIVSAVVEIFLNEPKAFDNIIIRSARVLKSASEEFGIAMLGVQLESILN